MGITTISSSGYQPVIGHALVHSIDKTHVLDVTVDLIWLLFLNILSFNFPATPRKSVRFTRFKWSYVTRTAFLLDVCCLKMPCHFQFFYSCLFPIIMHLRCWAHLLLECCELQGGSGDKQMWNSHKYIKFNSWSYHSIAHRTTFSPISAFSRGGKFGMFAHSTT